MGKNGSSKRRGTPVGLRLAHDRCVEFFDKPLAKMGLVARHEITDDTDYFIVPTVGGLELLWYFEIGSDERQRAVLELGIDGKDYSRIFWVGGKAWQYSFVGGEDEKKITERGTEFLISLSQGVATDFLPGREMSVSEELAKRIVAYHGEIIVTERSKKR